MTYSAQRLTKDSVQSLVNETSQPAVTIYIPIVTSASPPHITENQIRVKNLFNQAAALLDERVDGHGLSAELTELLAKLHNDVSFWEQHTPGLLFCATPGDIRLFSLPIETEEYVSVDDSFHLAPVLGLLSDHKQFYVLSLAQKAPQLFKGDMYGLKAAEVILPHDASQALGLDEPSQANENRSSARGSSTNNGSYNGRGGAHNTEEDDRARYFRSIDDAITNKADRSLPLILAGVESDVAEYRQLSKYPNILSASIAGNHKDDTDDHLFKQAFSIAWQELVIPEHQAAIEEYQRLQGANPERVASDSTSVEQAAKEGRVDKLLARTIQNTSDTVQDGFDEVLRITFPEHEQSRRLNKLAAVVYGMSGKVISLLPSEMPDGALMVARLRY